LHTLPSNGNDALAHDARCIRFGDLSEATTGFRFVGNLQLNAHISFPFLEFSGLTRFDSLERSDAKQRIHAFFKIRFPSRCSRASTRRNRMRRSQRG
jgi:hypothetical protein